MKYLIPILLAGGLAGCNQSKDIRIANDKVAEVQAQPRSEPIYYNGKTYQFDMIPGGSGAFSLMVKGMSPKQEKDAAAVASSSLRYFACADGQTGVLTGRPSYENGIWVMQGHCG